MSKTILVVDDSNFARKILSKSLNQILQDKDILLTEACDGEKALAIINEGIPDFMFLDLTMPVMNGYQLLSELKKLNIEIPTVVISADIQEEAAKKVKELGVLGFLNKPLNHSQVGSILSEVKILWET